MPRYGADCLSSVVPALLSPVGTSSLPPWFPEVVRGARATVLVVLDGLGRNQLDERIAITPVLSSMDGTTITTVAPTTTATALTSLTTGLAPGEHGLIGYRIDMGDTVLNTLRWGDARGDRRLSHPPAVVQSCPPFLGARVPVVGRADLESSAFTEAHMAGVRAEGWKVPSSIAVTCGSLVASGENFVYAYYDGIDKVAHAYGFGAHYDAELQFADRIVGDVLAAVDSDTAVIVTADHGQVHVGDRIVALDPAVAALVHHQSGEGRFRWLHARKGRERDLQEACEAHADVAWVVTREQAIDEQWFGPRVPDHVVRRMGEVALVAREAVSFDDPDEPSAFSLVCRHGSMTPDEVFVPLLAARGTR